MGADKKTITKKCGEILLSLKTNKKSKVYIFNCFFCSFNCDQLKKLKSHLDEKHLQKFCDEDEPMVSVDDDELLKHEDEQCNIKQDVTTIDSHNEDVKEDLEVFVPEIKVEELMDIDLGGAPTEDYDDDDEDKKHTSSTNAEEESADPLETPIGGSEKGSTSTVKVKTLTSTEVDVKNEKREDDSDDGGGDVEDNNYDFNCEPDYEDSVDGSGSDSDHSEKKAKSFSSKGKQTKLLRKRTPKKVAKKNK